MKLSTKIILPIILISALLILLAGCFGVPDDDSPGYTPGAISGTIARPEVCCEEPSESYLVGDAISPNICDVLDLCDPQHMADWYAWANVEVTLTTWVDCEEVKIASTMTDENGHYLFENVPPGTNYIITAICPEEIDFKVKDVAEEVVEGETYDAGIADAESTVLALCLEGLGEICLDSDVLDLDDFRDHWKYEKVVCEVCEKLAECLHAMPVWVCEITELCPGYTPTGDDDDDDECDGNIAPSITSVELNGNPISINDTVNVDVGTPYTITVNATDDGILGSLSYSATVDGTSVGTVVSNVATVTPLVAGTFEVYVYVNDGCDTTPWGPVTVNTVTYNVTYDANGGTGSQTDTLSPYYAGVTVTVLGQGGIARTNYTFTGWNTESGGGGTSYVAGNTFTMPTEDVILYAQWTEDTKYNVTYDANGGTGSQTDTLSPYYAGVTVTVLDKGTMARDKYNFTGWNTAADGTGDDYVENDTFTMPAANVTLYAQWEKLDPLMSPIDVVPGQNQIRINLRDVNNNPVLGLDNMGDWEVVLSVANSDSTILTVEYGGPAIGPWDFQIRVVNIPTGTLLRNVTVTYYGYGYPLILHEAY